MGIFKVFSILSNIDYDNQKKKLKIILAEKGYSDSQINYGVAAFDWAEGDRNLRAQMEKAANLPSGELEAKLNRYYIAMLSEEEIAYVLIKDRRKAKKAHKEAVAFFEEINKQDNEKPKNSMKKCPYCAEEIQVEAIFCRYCQHDLQPAVNTTNKYDSQSTEKLSREELIDLIKRPYAYSKRRTDLPVLSEIDLSGTDLSGVNLINANLSDSNLSGTNLSGANLAGAKLHRVNLNGAKLYGANLSGAQLFYADLSNADLRDVEISMTSFGGSKYNKKTLWPTGFDPKAVESMEEIP